MVGEIKTINKEVMVKTIISEEAVLLTMTKAEARELLTLVQWNITIPKAIYDAGGAEQKQKAIDIMANVRSSLLGLILS